VRDCVSECLHHAQVCVCVGVWVCVCVCVCVPVCVRERARAATPGRCHKCLITACNLRTAS
jgi:hypothetical protein